MKSTTKKIALYIGLIFMISSALTSGLSYNLATQISKQMVEDNLRATNQQVVGMIETSANLAIENHLKTISDKNLEVVSSLYLSFLKGEISEDEAKLMAKRVILAQKIGTTGYSYVINSKGDVLIHPKSQNIGQNYAEYAFIQRQIANKQGFLEYNWKNPDENLQRNKVLYMSYFDKWDWIISASSYRDEFSEILEIDDIRQQIGQIKIGKTGYVSIINSQGLFIIHPTFEGHYAKHLNENNKYVIEQIVQMKNGSLNYNWQNGQEEENREKRAIFEYIPEYDWYIVSTAYLDELLNPFIKIQLIGLLSIPFGILGLVITVLLFKSNISYPIEVIKEAFSKGASGDLGVRISFKKADDFIKLGQQFNQFMETLEEAKEDLENALYVRTINENRTKQLLNSANDGFIFMTKGLYVVETNDAMGSLLAKKPDELLGKHLTEILSHRLANEIESKLNVDSNQCIFGFELVLNDYERDRYYMVNVSSVENDNGAEIGYFAIFTDVTPLRALVAEKDYLLEQYSDLNSKLESIIEERTKTLTEKINELTLAQEKLIQSEKLSSLGIVVSGVVNQLNSPLGNSITMTSYIENQCSEKMQQIEEWQYGSIEEFKADTKEIIRNNWAASQMVLENLKKAVQGINSLKHVYPETIKGRKEYFDFATLVEEIQEMYVKELKVSQRNIVVIGDSNIQLYTYKEFLKQIMTNLIDNALIHGLKKSHDGTVTIEVSKQGEDMVLSVEDDGEGIPTEQLEKIFEPFYKVDGTSSSLGLGLYTVYNLVTMTLRGTVKCSSVPGFGTKLTLELPGMVFEGSVE